MRVNNGDVVVTIYKGLCQIQTYLAITGYHNIHFKLFWAVKLSLYSFQFQIITLGALPK
jgi:hypothetical protein